MLKVDRFNSLGSFIDYCATNEPKFNGAVASKKTNNVEWRGTANFDDALKLARNGWTDKAEEMANAERPILNKLTSMIERANIVYDVEGSQLDIARYLDDEPECWQRWEHTVIESTGTKHLRIVLNGLVSAGVGTHVITAKGMAIATLVEALEFAGNRVQVDVAGQYGSNYAFYITVKQYEQPLDLPHLAYALAHPSMLRRLIFRLLESQTFCDKLGATEESKGYGGIGDGWHWTTQCDEQGDLYIGHSYVMDYQWTNAKATEQWIKAELTRQGITLKGE